MSMSSSPFDLAFVDLIADAVAKKLAEREQSLGPIASTVPTRSSTARRRGVGSKRAALLSAVPAVLATSSAVSSRR
jgi:hypothetical protein